MFKGLKGKLQNLAGWFQPAYNKIKAWDLPPEVDKLFENLWKVLSPDIQKAIWHTLRVMYNKFGKERAKEMLEAMIKYLSKVFSVK